MGETEYDIVKAVMNLTIDSISKNLDKTNKEKAVLRFKVGIEESDKETIYYL